MIVSLGFLTLKFIQKQNMKMSLDDFLFSNAQKIKEMISVIDDFINNRI
jgi:hypothetical protein